VWATLEELVSSDALAFSGRCSRDAHAGIPLTAVASAEPSHPLPTCGCQHSACDRLHRLDSAVPDPAAGQERSRTPSRSASEAVSNSRSISPLSYVSSTTAVDPLHMRRAFQNSEQFSREGRQPGEGDP
jgi:hypothetical protein